MSRGTMILVTLLVVIVAGLLWLSRARVAVTPHPIEQAVTLNGAADASQH